MSSDMVSTVDRPTVIAFSGSIARSLSAADASEWMTQHSQGNLVVINFSAEALPSLSPPYSAFSHPNHETNQPPEQVAHHIPFLALSGPRSDRIVRITITCGVRFATVAVHTIGQLPFPLESNIPHATNETVVSIVKRSALAAAGSTDGMLFIESLTNEIGAHNRSFFTAAINAATSNADQLLSDHEHHAEQHRNLYQRILRIRASLTYMRTCLGADQVAYAELAALQAVIAECDALTSAFAGMATVVQYETALEHARQQQLRDDRTASHDRLISRLVSALALPALWLGLLGTDVLPHEILGIHLQSWPATALAILVAIFFGMLGWLAMGRKQRHHDEYAITRRANE